MLYDAKKYLGVAKTLCPKADGYRLEALASFAYNLGGTRLAGSTLRRHTNHGDFEKAAEEFNKWVYAGGVKLAGLVLRREVERSIFMKGGD
jgi:GH24 family phage-related lysozyme (muramidase)